MGDPTLESQKPSPMALIHGYLKQARDFVKMSLLTDVPPGVAWQNGQSLPTQAQFKSFTERYPLASIFPYESYDPEAKLYYNH